MILPLYVTNGDREIKTFALLDGGANRHVVSKDISRRLKMNGKTVNMRITTLEKTVEGEREVADVSVRGTNGHELILSGAIFGDIIASGGDAPPRCEDIAKIAHLSGINFPEFPGSDGDIGDVDVGVIIGAEHAHVWMAGERR